MKDNDEGGGKRCSKDGIGKGEEKEREDSIRITDTDLYNRMNLQVAI